MRRYSQTRHMSLHKVLPSAPNSVRSRRQLHTAFWNHGAASVELFGACHALLGEAMEERRIVESPEKTEEKRADLMTASAFVLDFLYPRGSLSLLRRLNRITLDGYEKPTFRFNNPLSRFQVASVSSTAYNRTAAPQRIELDDASVENADTACAATGQEAGGRAGVATGGPARETFPAAEEPTNGADWEAFLSMSESTLESARPSNKVIPTTDEGEFKKFLALRSWGLADTVWEKYDHLPPDVRDQYTMEVLRYVALSERLLEPQRYCKLLFAVPAVHWTKELVGGGIRAAISLDDLPSAIAFGSQTLDTRALVHGFDLLVAHTLKKEHWDGLVAVFDTFRDTLNSEKIPLVVELPATVSMPQLAAKLQQFWQHLRSLSPETDWSTLKEKYQALLHLLWTKCIGTLKPGDATFIVKKLGEAVPYEDFIKLCADRGDNGLAAELYTSYRKLPDVKIRIPVLRAMIRVFFPHNDVGMETVLKDWYGRYDNLDYIAYRRFIQWYAGRGDVKSVLRLWKEYKTIYARKRRAERDFRTVAALMQVYAVRGDVAKAREVMEEITVGRGIEPNTVHLNMLLNAHAKAWDLPGALKTFAELCDKGEPDDYSFGTLMGMTGSRGNIQLTLGLYKTARDMGVEPSLAMVDSLVEAYCQNDRLIDAENICKLTTTRKMLPGTRNNLDGMPNSSYTVLWNTLLDHYAGRHDLTNVNRVLEKMTKLKLPYDGKTYEHILQALVNTRQSHHALALLEISAKKGVFIPAAEHYLILMSGFLRTREPAAVVTIGKMMTEKNFPQSAEKMTKLVEAFGQWAQMPEGQRVGTEAHYFLVAALAAFRASLGSEESKGRDDLRSVTNQYSKMINILTQTREFATIPEVMTLFKSQFPEHSTTEATPLQLLNSLLRANFYEKKFDSVKETWKIIFDKVRGLDNRSKPGLLPSPVSEDPRVQTELLSVPPSHRHLLNDALNTVMRVFESENDGEGLIALVAKVQQEGFTLGQRNWNFYIQALARVGQWTEACHVCESVLMPGWKGWARRRHKAKYVKNMLPLDLRRLGKSDRHARPNTHTLLILIQKYMEVENMAPWSPESGKLLESINESCPRLVHAAKTMVLNDSELELEIFGESTAVGDGDDDLIQYMVKDKEFFRTEDEARMANIGHIILPTQKPWNKQGEKATF